MLKSLELFGFKSFADRTLFEFSPGITCVVGPNGSGKSNVVDALKWILGDQSPKSLRGKEMSDVIFNGSAGRRESGFAEATLTFDNTQQLLPLDTSEVQIGRRLYQSGDSEYLLNQTPVRLKDIRDIFMGTGAGTAAYSIIEQGRVDQILQANPTARRLVFEEAAGISKFKARRVEAERRLERVAQNLVRLTDIVDQVESQLNATRSQASKAARYRDLAAELKQAWTGLAADDCHLLSSRLNQQLDELENMARELSLQQEELSRVEAQNLDVDQRLSLLEESIREREHRVAATRAAIAAAESTIRYQSIRRDELEADQQRLRQQRLGLVRQVDFARAELAATAEQLSAFESQFELTQQQLSARQDELSDLDTLAEARRSNIARQRRELADARARQQQLGERLVVAGSQAEALRQNQAQAERRMQQLQTQLAAASRELEQEQVLLQEAETAFQSRQSQLSDAQRDQLRLAQHQSETDAQLQSLRERRSAVEARLTVLEELEERQEGIAIGVREILSRARTSHYPPWNRILGTVRDLIDVPLDLAPIIDAALGERAQLVAVTDLAPLLDYLNRGAAPIEGRVGFVSIAPLPAPALDSGPWRALSVPEPPFDLTGRPGVFGRADRLVQERDRAQGLAGRVLGDTWIVETLDVARQVLAKAPPAVRAVTLQGEVLTSGELLFVGSVPHESSIVSRKSELRQLKNEIHQLNRGIDVATERQAILASDFDQQSEEVRELSAELKQLSSAVTQRATLLAAREQNVRRLEQERTEQQSALAELAEREAGLQNELRDLNEQLTTADAAVEQACEEVQAQEELMRGVEQLLGETQHSIKADQLELAKHEERLKGLRQTQSRLIRDQSQRQQQLVEANRRIREIQQLRRGAEIEILQATSAVATLALQLQHAFAEVRDQTIHRDQLRQERRQLAHAEEQIHQFRRRLLDRQHALEFDVQKQRLQLKTLADRIQEEFQTPLEDLVESGVSAYRDFLAERYGSQAVQEIIAHAGETDPSSPQPGQPVPDTLQQSALIPTYEDVREELEARVDRLRRKLKTMGNVNTDALEGLEELEERHSKLAGQLKDLQEAKASLEDIIRRINHESQRIFMETFETIRGHFRELFRKLFGGGDADIILEDPEDVLECGIDIVARPPGKELRSISLLSGGEKTMTAVGLLFAMFKSKPSPYCILDEVDAALDEANVDRYVALIKEFVQMTQFVVITHRKRTMTAANVLYGVTMEQAGVSKRISVRFEDVRDNGEIRTAA